MAGPPASTTSDPFSVKSPHESPTHDRRYESICEERNSKNEQKRYVTILVKDGQSKHGIRGIENHGLLEHVVRRFVSVLEPKSPVKVG